MAKSFNNIFPAPETVYNRPLSFPVGVQPINSAPFVRPGGFVAPRDQVQQFPIEDRPAVPPGWGLFGPNRPEPVPRFEALDRPYTCVHPSSFDSANNCLKGGGTYKSNKPCGPVADSVAAERCPDPVDDGNLLLDARDSKGVLCSGPNFSGAITNCADGSRPAVDCNNNPLPCGEKHNQAAVNCADTICTAVMVSCPNGGQAANLPYYNSVTNQCGCRGNCNPITDPLPPPPVVGGCNGDQACRQDARQCLDGQWKGRNPCNNCDFFPCGAPGNFTYQPLAKVFVPPNPNNNKDTLFARNENNLSLPLAKLNMTREEMGDVLVSNMSPARYAQELMNQRDIPNYVGISTNMPPAPHTTFDVAMADGRNQRMTFPNGPICGPGGKQTVFSNSLTLNDFLNNNLNVNDNPQGPKVCICTFRNDNFVFGAGGCKPHVAFNPNGDCSKPHHNNGIVAGAVPVLSLVAASNFADVGVGEAPASIPSRSVKNVSEPLSILKDRAVSTFLVTKSNSVARKGNIIGLRAQIEAVFAQMLIIDARIAEIKAEIDALNAEIAALHSERNMMFFTGENECWYWSRTVPREYPTIEKVCIRPGTETASCVEFGSVGEGVIDPRAVGTFQAKLRNPGYPGPGGQCIGVTIGHTFQEALDISREMGDLGLEVVLKEIQIEKGKKDLDGLDELLMFLQQKKDEQETIT